MISYITMHFTAKALDAPLYAPTYPARMPLETSGNGMPGISKLLEFQKELYFGARPQSLMRALSLYEFGVRMIFNVGSSPLTHHSADLLRISLIHIPLNDSGAASCLLFKAAHAPDRQADYSLTDQ